MSGKRVYGIDLGTTYSCIANVDEHGKPVVLMNDKGQPTTPSVVYFESRDNIVVGQDAKDVVKTYPDLCVETVKRVMGDANWERTIWDQKYRPQEIASHILRKLASDAEKVTGEKVEDVVITCPAYFGINQKEATKQAGEIAGLNVRYVIPEPTAAALAYGISQEKDEVILVFDLGGGTFDITVIEIKSSQIRVIGTGGDHELGGKDWDDKIVEYLMQKFEETSGTPAKELLDDTETYQELLKAAEKCKMSLSNRQTIPETVRFGTDKVKVELSRDSFNEITRPLLERALMLTDQEIANAAKHGYARIDKLLLVGGSTYMPQVMEAIKARYPYEVLQFDPNQAVAKGAAMFGFKCYLEEKIRIVIAESTGQSVDKIDVSTADARVMQEAVEKVAADEVLTLPGVKAIVTKRIANVTSKSFGLVVMSDGRGKVVANLIQRDDSVPTSKTEKFGTAADDQMQVDLQCMESELRDQKVAELDACKDVGSAVLSFSRPLPKGSPVEITFELSPDGLLRVHGKDLTTGGILDAEFKTASIMSREDVEQAKQKNLLKRIE